ncbi:zinc-binding alcohol dehydrogenase family protein [Photobacterium profundum]|uniref:Zinc-type alcohol dehydrogenase-like protein n=1 Tax=Photobacterium profundum (strain SS9) TaxID=298386 RepID=Q6LQB0_PHOPR|nr:zinc-binding alcohol dehydrogenase family protein [Photobacterium profundum]CAG20516.1 putative alcohol dehydrogenase, zinc-containing [Photobacterium profundum SS9]
MKAIGYLEAKAIDQPDALLDIELPMPTATGRDVLVNVNAISVNPVDTKIRRNAQPNEGEHKILGWDAVGEIVAIGGDVEHYKVGDKVWYAGDITRQGTNAEYHLVDERIVGKQPLTLSNTEAAALPLTAITAWELLFDRLGFDRLGFNVTSHVSSDQEANEANKPTDTRLLIVGASGGVGSILTQLAVKLTNATVIGTASRKESQAWVTSLGADYVIDHSKSLTEELTRIGISDVTHVISLTHTDKHFDEIVEALAPQGQLALIDDPQEPIDIMKLKRKSLSLHWELMFTRSMFQTADMDKQRQLLNAVSSLIDDGELVTTLGQNFGKINAENLIKAHAYIESGKSIGKVVLEGF